ncbi:hypothetical protein MUO32_09535 [Shinella sp. CPCC 101442]|uniref:hypothetical protein n=1 Tax=Shinella sp. CPCC 101442 TaxID=2932265 RepID=UPI0021527857|nr:hypothetical protein [Shinella sp. CPCC 101442]MCR6499272.1 hypothetical protein [Shinella sp. CPCC 101442]
MFAGRSRACIVSGKDFDHLYNNYQKAVAGIKKPTIKSRQVNFKDSQGVQALGNGIILAAYRAARHPERF